MAEQKAPDDAAKDAEAKDAEKDDAEDKAPARPSQRDLARQREQAMTDAMERERSASRTTDDLGEAEVDANDQLWVHSNRKDDRVVLAETHPMHPGGQAFVGGEGVMKVGRSPEVERLLYRGELIEVAEPPKTIKNEKGEDVPNPKYPVIATGSGVPAAANQPGQPTELGRSLDPAIWGEDGDKVVREARRRQRSMPSLINPDPGGITPPGMPGTAETRAAEARAASRR